MYKHILIPTDGSLLSAKAIEEGGRLAASLRARISVVTVTEPFHIFSFSPRQIEDTPDQYAEHVRQRAEALLADARRRVEAAGADCEAVSVEHEHPYQAIIDTARSRGCDLIAMASHGRRGIGAVVIGSETTKVLTHSTLPVLVYR